MSDDFLKEKVDMLKEGLEYMERVVELVDETCSKLRKKEGIETIGQLSEGLMAIIQIVDYTKRITDIEIDEDNLTGFVSDMVDGMENGDFNLIADIIEYEVKPLYEEWSGIFAKVIEQNA